MAKTDQKPTQELHIRPEEDRDADGIREVLVSAFAREKEAALVDKLRCIQDDLIFLGLNKTER